MADERRWGPKKKVRIISRFRSDDTIRLLGQSRGFARVAGRGSNEQDLWKKGRRARDRRDSRAKSEGR